MARIVKREVSRKIRRQEVEEVSLSQISPAGRILSPPSAPVSFLQPQQKEQRKKPVKGVKMPSAPHWVKTSRSSSLPVLWAPPPPAPVILEPEVVALMSFFAGITDLSGSFPLNKYTYMHDVKMFVDANLIVLQGKKTRADYLPCLYRLRELKALFLSDE